MAKAAFTVYLAGPISGCNRAQRRQWREDFKQLLGRDYAFADPAEWQDDWDPSREMLSIDASDVVVANMWKESIGTTIGVMHARMDGKPVVLLDPNLLQHKILAGLVHPETPVRTLPEAAERVRAIRSAARPLEVLKTDGQQERFSRDKLVRSIRSACAAAGVDDTILPLQIIGRVNEQLRLPSDARPLATGDIKRAVVRVLEGIAGNPVYQAEVRESARGIQRAWEKKEKFKSVDQLFDEAVAAQKAAEERAESAEREAVRLRALVAELSTGRHAPPPPAPAPPVIRKVTDAVTEARARFGGELTLLDSAVRSASESPYRHPERAFRALEVLAACARERMEAKRSGRHVPGLRDWFAAHRDRLPGLEFKPKESPTTLGNWAAERTFVVDGAPVLMEMHLALGDGGPEAALRIHFAVEEPTGRLVVGHVGRHLTNTRS